MGTCTSPDGATRLPSSQGDVQEDIACALGNRSSALLLLLLDAPQRQQRQSSLP